MFKATAKAALWWLCSLVLLQSFHYSKGFLAEPALTRKSTEEKRPSLVVAKATSSAVADLKDDDELQVVLFGVGDLRVDDHQGLVRAVEHGNNKNPAKILPLIILSDDSMSKIPGVISHTMDTSNMIVEAVKDLQSNLRDNLALELQVVQSKKSVTKALADILKQQCDSNQKVRVHVHDLGDADNSMMYGTYGPIRKERNILPSNVKVSPWTCHLREKPWETVESLPERYPDFEKKFAASQMPALPVSVSGIVKDGSMSKAESVPLSTSGKSDDDATVGIPTSKQLTERIQGKLGLNSDEVKAGANTGIFQSHWGGLDASTVVESKVLKVLDTFVNECAEEDALWVKNGQYVASKCPRNPRSLEHATYAWMQQGTGKKAPFPETDNLLAGEPMTRYLAAPLTLGTLSPRRLWHMSTRQRPFFVSPLKTLVEGREWHKLLAARNMRTQPEYQPNSELAAGSETRYGYWRWHGFLCRYAQTPLTADTKELDSSKDLKKEGVLLFHGFGASGAQWNKALQELSTIIREEEPEGVAMEGLAPDLLGFGQSEKPALSYSIYVWDAQCTDFIKEVAVARQGWDGYVVGGNSIGGFSAASTAANECAEIDGDSVCSSGAPGTGKCRGVVLMNPAGPIKSREESETQMMMTVAQTSATDALPPCSPLARPVARVFGNGLLSYLRPRIQSICKNLYPTNPAAVDDALCYNIERDSVDLGAIGVMVSGTKLPPPRSMNEMLQADYGKATEESIKRSVPEVSFGGPVLVATGVLDPLNDAKGRSEGLAALRAGIEFDPVNAGHCPHDELPKDVASKIAKWMMTTVCPMNLASSASSQAQVSSTVL